MTELGQPLICAAKGWLKPQDILTAAIGAMLSPSHPQPQRDEAAQDSAGIVLVAELLRATHVVLRIVICILVGTMHPEPSLTTI